MLNFIKSVGTSSLALSDKACLEHGREEKPLVTFIKTIWYRCQVQLNIKNPTTSKSQVLTRAIPYLVQRSLAPRADGLAYGRDEGYLSFKFMI